MSALIAARGALANRNVLAAELGYCAYAIVLHGAWLAALVYAFSQGGVIEAGLVAFGVLLPAALAAPLLSVAAGRLDPSRALGLGYAIQALACGVTAATIWMDAPAIVTYIGVAVLTAAQLPSRPTLLSMLPSVVSHPSELAAANATAGLIETLGSFLGPAAAASLLFSTSPAVAFAAAGILMAVATVSAALVRTSRDDDGLVVTASAWREMAGGVRALRSRADVRLIVTMIAAGLFIFGALSVALAAIAVDQLGQSEATAALLGSAIGIGGVIGAVLSFLLVGLRRLTIPLALALLSVAVPIMAVSAAESLVLVLALLALTGLGRPVMEVAGRTLLQGLSAEDDLAQVFGLLEGLNMAALAIGSLVFSLAAGSVGLDVALIAFGAVLPCLLIVQFRQLREIDHARPEVDTNLLALLRTSPIFAPLPAFQVEQLLVGMDEHQMAPGEIVFLEGDTGDRLHVVVDGSALVELPDGEVETDVGGYFGEIALLRDQPRMATVRAGAAGLRTRSLDRDAFLAAISGVARSSHRTSREVARRLGEDEHDTI
ncbi:MAG: cyclic nucleotide-binding domain-containing protein [Actinomycetota bacterium]